MRNRPSGLIAVLVAVLVCMGGIASRWAHARSLAGVTPIVCDGIDDEPDDFFVPSLPQEGKKHTITEPQSTRSFDVVSDSNGRQLRFAAIRAELRARRDRCPIPRSDSSAAFRAPDDSAESH